MDDVAFDAMTRRASVAALGVAGLARFMAPAASDAKKKHKKKFDVNKFCKKQVPECNTLITVQCAGDPDCLDALPCCQELATCDFGGFLNCLVAAAA